MTVEPNYIKKLERENAQLKDSKYNYIELYKQQLGKNNLLQEENEKLKQRIKGFVSENTKLQNLLYVEQMNQDEADYKIAQLKNEIVELKQQLYYLHVMKTRLLKILNETSDYT